MAIIAVLVLLLLPVFGQPKSRVPQVTCANNLRQVGQAIQMFADENADYLPPGPKANIGLLTGQTPGYTTTSKSSLSYYLATYLGSPAPSSTRTDVRALFCPAFERYNTAYLVTTISIRYSYALNDGMVPEDPYNLTFKPFGYPSPLEYPHTIADIQAQQPLSKVYSIMDADKLNYTNTLLSWRFDLPDQPVHGKTRNALYFDGHVAPRLVGKAGTR
ncbi:MAG: hypothetical protein WCO56_26105 [Verrucomicrobiota bacterium]